LLLTRILTAAVLLAGFTAALFYLERAAFAALVAVVIALGAHEWGRLAGLRRAPLLAYAAACVLLYGVLQGTAFALYVGCAAAVFWIAAAPLWLSAGVRAERRWLLLAAGAVALVPAGLAAATLPPRYLLMALGLVWVADSAAYFVGSAFGRHKLAPSISPGKTWEGVAGGAFAGVIYAIIWATFDAGLRARVQEEIWMPFLAGALLLCALSVIGDLLESALKRQAGAKDSGWLLPGHGGVLDRIDSATATLPAALLMLRAMGTA
jgi:phosphatidate cytidylyltransferase